LAHANGEAALGRQLMISRLKSMLWTKKRQLIAAQKIQRALVGFSH
jgi:hypothetical protein